MSSALNVPGSCLGIGPFAIAAPYGTVTALTVADNPPVRAVFNIPWKP